MIQSLSTFLESANGAPLWKVWLFLAVLILATIRIGYVIVTTMRRNREMRMIYEAVSEAEARFHAKQHETDGRAY